MKQHIALVGLSGTGKSAAGQELAHALELPFVDTDREVERVAGMPIHRVFSELGEPEFRRLEAEAVARALAGEPSVVALGGGAILDAHSRELIWRRAVVVWLRTEPGELLRRLESSERDEPRPLLAGNDLLLRLTTMLREREPHYCRAQIHVDTDGRAPIEVAEEIARRLARRA